MKRPLCNGWKNRPGTIDKVLRMDTMDGMDGMD